MTAFDIAQHRLINQQLVASDFKNACELVKWFGAIQAQEYALAKWAIGVRLPHLLDADIEKNSTDGTLLRTHVLRPTWHFVTAADIRWLLKITAPRVHVANAFMYRKMELDKSVFHRCHDILIRELQGNKQLTRTFLNAAFKRHGILADGQRLSYIMMQAELEGVICSGARQGKQFTYALLEERVPPVYALTPEESLAELTTRYLKSRGPATSKDFATWSGLTLTEARRGMALVETGFLREKIAGEDYYFPEGMSTNKESFRNTWLLPVYDEFIMGYKNRAAILCFQQSLTPAPAFLYDNTLVQAGQIIGTWKRTLYKNFAEIMYQLFKPFTEEQAKAFNQAFTHFSQFIGVPVSVSQESQYNRQ